MPITRGWTAGILLLYFYTFAMVRDVVVAIVGGPDLFVQLVLFNSGVHFGVL